MSSWSNKALWQFDQPKNPGSKSSAPGRISWNLGEEWLGNDINSFPETIDLRPYKTSHYFETELSILPF
jgi:hypothetical protein